MGMQRRWIVIGGLAAAGFALGLMSSTDTATAQRPMPTATPDQQAQLRRYGARHSLPLVNAPDGANTTAVLNIASSGWRPIDALVVELDPATATSCDTPFDAGRIKRVTCVKGLARWASTEVALTGGAESALVYSIDPAKIADACAGFDAVRSGRQTLAQWEQMVWSPGMGAPLSLNVVSRTAGAVTAFTGQTSLATGRAAGGMNARTARSLPILWTDVKGARARLMNPSAQCLQMTATAGDDRGSASCAPPGQSRVNVPPLGAADVRAGGNGALAGTASFLTAPQTAGNVLDAAIAADHIDAAGWMSYNGPSVLPNSQYGPAFPLAVGPFTDLKSELWVTNNHVTATARIALLMFTGNLTAHIPYNDPVPLCPGGTRRYDIQAIAGEIPPTKPRENGPEGPPQLSVRLEATSDQVATFVPVSGVMILKSDQGITAYEGLVAPPELQAARGRPGAGGVDVTTAVVVPGVKKLAGDQRLTTYMSVMVLGNPQAENGIVIDFYDMAGKPVLLGAPRAMGNGPAAQFDLREIVARGQGDTPARLPDGFVGTAVVRGSQNRGMLGVVAVDRPAEPLRPGNPRPLGADEADQAPAADVMFSYTGILLPMWPDPDAPTPTPLPTSPPRTPTATGPTPEGPTPETPTPMVTRIRPTVVPEATPTPSVVQFWKLYLPWLANGVE